MAGASRFVSCESISGAKVLLLKQTMVPIIGTMFLTQNVIVRALRGI